jgi:phosphohistidine phosphatase SixA
MRITWLLCLSLIVSSVGADESLWLNLKQDPNMIVFMRNAESSGNRDGINMLSWDATGKCKGESMLTDEGKAHAKKIGAAFTKHGIKAKVISSPMCRCTETAEIAFGEYVTDPELRQKSPEDTPGQDSFQEKAIELFSKYRGSTPIVFVNHRPNIDSLTMELMGIGELLIGTVAEDGEVEVLGKIRVES